MSDIGLDLEEKPRRRRHRESARPTRRAGCLAVLIALAVLVGGGYFLVDRGVAFVQERIGGAPEDYPGPGEGSVVIEVTEGQSSTDIGRTLVEEDVVASLEAFTEAAAVEPDAVGIQVGFYQLQQKMAAVDALDVLIDPANLSQASVAVPEGLTVDQIVSTLAKGTDFSAAQYRRVLRRPDSIGLPDYAEGNAEGYLFPATYEVPPNATPRSVLTAMVDRWRQAADEAGLEERAEALGYTPQELMTVASLIESEASRAEDRGKVARVIYNRLEGDETNGLLQLDATVNYAAGRNLGARTSLEDLEIDSPYNTYQNPGLPPTPIEAPGDAAIEAAGNPTDGPWYYYVTVDLGTGETKFAETYDEFLGLRAELDAYCETSDAC